MTSPERSSNSSSPIYDHDSEPQVTAVDLRKLLAAPGWHIDPPSTATRLSRDEPVPVVEPEDLDGFEGDNWIPPAVPEGEQAVALVTVAARSKRGRRIFVTVATIVVITAGVALSNSDTKRPSPSLAASPTTRARSITPISVASYQPLAIDANAVILAAQRLKTTATTGLRIENAETRSADPTVLDYVLAITPESVKVGAPDVLRGASNTHVTASSTAANVAALRLDDPTSAKDALDKAINGEYQLDLWFNRAGNLIRLTVYTADTVNEGRIEVTFAEPVALRPAIAGEPFVDDNAPSKQIPEPATTVEETTNEAPTTTEDPTTTAAPTTTEAPATTEAPTTTRVTSPQTTVKTVHVATTKAP